MTEALAHLTGGRALLVDDDYGQRNAMRFALDNVEVTSQGVSSAEAAIQLLERARFDLAFVDIGLPGRSGLSLIAIIRARWPETAVVVITASTGSETSLAAGQAGADAFVPKPATAQMLQKGAETALTKRRGLLPARAPAGAVDDDEDPDAPFGFRTRSSIFAEVMQRARSVAADPCSVMLLGPEGTGKNVLARWIKDHSARRDKPMVTVIGPELTVEFANDVLFGHARGAFTGAVTATRGKVQEADGGTLFIDEVGDIPLAAQPLLLRYFQEQEFNRRGDLRDHRVDVRVLSATNRDMHAAIACGAFRGDLFRRLNGYEIVIPTLGARREDIVPMARRIFGRLQAVRGISGFVLSADTERVLEAYAWPGNVRELEHVLERAVVNVRCAGPFVDPEHLALPRPQIDPQPRRAGDDVTVAELERDHILRVCAVHGASAKAARILGISLSTLHRRLEDYRKEEV